jgi:hypothetical protein
MFTDEEKAQCVLSFAETKPLTLMSVQLKFRNKFRRKDRIWTTSADGSYGSKKLGVSVRESDLEDLQLKKLDLLLLLLLLLFWWVHQEHCVHRRNETSATYEGRTYWNSQRQRCFFVYWRRLNTDWTYVERQMVPTLRSIKCHNPSEITFFF